MATATRTVAEICESAKRASRELAVTSTEAKNAALVRLAELLGARTGEILEARTLESGLRMRKVRVPLGVIAVVYEARPNVTVDCAALTLKSGNAIVLRGSSYAVRSNGALAAVVDEAVSDAGLPQGTIELLGGAERAGL